MKHEQIFQMSISKGQRSFEPSETMRVLTRNQNIYFSWGVSKRVNLNGVGFILKVSGHHHNGWVLITLGWDDLYRVHLIKNNGEIKEEIFGIYFEDLVKEIDDRIERIKEYDI